MTPEVDAMLRAIEGRYGQYPTDRQGKRFTYDDVAAYLERELDLSTRDKQIAVKDAIAKRQPLDKGPPDVATIESAIWKWSADGLGSLKKTVKDWTSSEKPEDLTPEDEARGMALLQAIIDKYTRRQ